MEVTVRPVKCIDEMWVDALNAARCTVGKKEASGVPTDRFKMSSLRSKHSHIRRLRFEVMMRGVPAHVTQQFSRHHIAISSMPGALFVENINPTDVEHFVRSSREDRTGIPRGDRRQNDPVDYLFDINAAGLFAASEKRLCRAADAGAVVAWNIVREGVAAIDPLVAARMVPSCVAYGFCTEDPNMVSCRYHGSAHYAELRNSYTKPL